jgi:pentatricopeptide repeat protein
LEAEVLPLYEKYKIKHDVYTYQHLIKMYLNLRDMDTLMALWDRMRKQEQFSPNDKILQNVLEAGIR